MKFKKHNMYKVNLVVIFLVLYSQISYHDATAPIILRSFTFKWYAVLQCSLLYYTVLFCSILYCYQTIILIYCFRYLHCSLFFLFPQFLNIIPLRVHVVLLLSMFFYPFFNFNFYFNFHFHAYLCFFILIYVFFYFSFLL